MLDRTSSLITSIIGNVLDVSLHSQCEALEVGHEFQEPFGEDIEDALNNIIRSVDAGILSTESAVELNPIVKDPNRESERLAAEAEELGLNQDESPQNYGVEPQDIPLMPQYSKVTEQEQMIMKILDKTEKPQISFNVSWDAYPNNELKMLKEYFNVTNDDIAKAIIKKYVSKEDLDNIVSEWVNKEQI